MQMLFPLYRDAAISMAWPPLLRRYLEYIAMISPIIYKWLSIWNEVPDR